MQRAAPMTAPRAVLCLLGTTVLASLSGCGWCDPRFNLTAEPSVVTRAIATAVDLRFEKPVFPPDTELRDIRVLLYAPSGYSIADFNDGMDDKGLITDGRVVDDSTIGINLSLPMEAPAGGYRFSLSYNDGGECDLAFGEVAMRVE
jgi:hypothetical protein